MNIKKIFYDWHGLNEAIFLNINHALSNPNIQSFFKYLSFFFNITNFAIYYIISFFIFIYFIRKNKVSQEDFFKNYNHFVKIGTCYAFIGLIYALIKFTVNLPRPFCSLETGDFFTIANLTLERCLSSFPSAHCAMAILISYSLWNFLPLAGRSVMVAISALVIISRIALAMHYPADILYSTGIAASCIYFANILWGLMKENLIRYVGKWMFVLLKDH